MASRANNIVSARAATTLLNRAFMWNRGIHGSHNSKPSLWGRRKPLQEENQMPLSCSQVPVDKRLNSKKFWSQQAGTNDVISHHAGVEYAWAGSAQWLLPTSLVRHLCRMWTVSSQL